MTCGGCTKAVTALVSKVDGKKALRSSLQNEKSSKKRIFKNVNPNDIGVNSVDASWETKEVVVKGDNINSENVTAAIKKLGKGLNFV
jgi:copper chaperone CopZ